MSKHDDGGPAFPSPEQQFTDGLTIVGRQGSYGMSLRDYFAGQAITGLIASCDRKDADGFIALGPDHASRLLAQSAYLIADAMIAAGNEGRQP